MGHFMESSIRDAKVQDSKLPINFIIARHSSPPALNVVQLDGRREMPLKSVNG